MSTSVLGHYVRFGEAAIDGLDPVDSGMAQRALGNLNHLADQYSQVRIKWVLRNGGNSSFGTNEDEELIGDWQLLWLSTAFDTHVREDGTSYRFRLRWSLKSSQASGTDPIFRAVLAPAGTSAREIDSPDDNVAEEQLSSALFAWVDHGSLLYLDSRRVVAASADVAAINEVVGDESAARWLRVELSVWAKLASPADDVAELGGLELEEYYP